MKRIRPKTLKSITYRKKTGCGYLYITISKDEIGAAEIFLTMGKCGGCIYNHIVVIARLSSLALRSGISIEDIQEQFAYEKCPQSVDIEPKVLSCAEAVAESIKEYILEMENNAIRYKEGDTTLNKTDDICSRTL